MKKKQGRKYSFRAYWPDGTPVELNSSELFPSSFERKIYLTNKDRYVGHLITFERRWYRNSYYYVVSKIEKVE